MKWRLVSIGSLIAIAILTTVLASGFRSRAESVSPAAPAPEYKVELVGYRERKDLERRLNDDARNGWHVLHSLVMGPDHNELVVILEKPAGSP